jgi:hypothetical protein
MIPTTRKPDVIAKSKRRNLEIMKLLEFHKCVSLKQQKADSCAAYDLIRQA